MSKSGASDQALNAEALLFAPGLLAIQESPPAPLPRTMLYSVLLLFLLLLAWATFGRLDIIASAQGRLVPRSYVKIVQPADAGIVKEILVHEGDTVSAGQVLLRMDPQEAQADTNELATQLALKSLQLRRIEAELAGVGLRRRADDPADLFERVRAQYLDRRQAYEDALAQAQKGLQRAQDDYQSGVETLRKLRRTNPLLKSQADSYADLGSQGYAAQVLVNEKQRDYLENEQDLRAQQAKVDSLNSGIAEAEEQVNEITSKYRSDLQNERVEAEGEYSKLQQDSIKQAHKSSLLELRAPQAGVVKDIATHTIGTVVSSGTVLLSLVPEREPLVAEVMVHNEDVGFVHPEQAVQVKLQAYPFQKYGMLQGQVKQVWPDADDANSQGSARTQGHDSGSATEEPRNYRALIELQSQSLRRNDISFALLAGMQITAEINEGRRSVLAYLLSPIQKVVQEGGRER